MINFTFRFTTPAGKTTVKQVKVSKTAAIAATVITTAVAIGGTIALGIMASKGK